MIVPLMWCCRHFLTVATFVNLVWISKAKVSNNCGVHEIEFIMIDGDANLLEVEDDIRGQLALVGFKVKPRILSKEAFNEAHQNGDFHLSFSETWGAPYDPHSYAAGWVAGDEGHQQAMSNLDGITREDLFQDIERVFREGSHKERERQWEAILNTVHQQAIMLPLWGKRIPTVLNNRLTGYEAGLQQFDYPVHRLEVISGRRSITISPGAQTGIFESVGRLDPHSYRPNEFFANNWVYEGLVKYGPQGQVLPALASSWDIKENKIGGQTYTFSLRDGVIFHDGSPWNCQVAKLNFDHVLAEPLRSIDYHGWYGVPKHISSWYCVDEMTFVLTTKEKYYAFLQELTFIRPLRMLSPASFVGSANPLTENSCNLDWGTITTGNVTVICVGIKNISGTGPFAYVSKTPSSGEFDDEVIFIRNENYWEGIPNVEKLVVQRYEASKDVKSALLNGTLDAVWGAGVLSAQDLQELEEESTLTVFHSEDIQNSILLLNSGKKPLDDITLRKTIMHAIDKKSITDKILGKIERPVDNIFPLHAPYCDIDLTPKWDYDIEKARLLNCNVSSMPRNHDLAVGLGVGLGICCIILMIGLLVLFHRKKKIEDNLNLLLKETAVNA
jgi:ABC-type transport system substrate-binding protein